MPGKQRYFIELSYDGTRYHGWQIQQNAVTVQETLDKALSIVFRQPVETTGCGRTDTGVHAREFFAHFDVEQLVVHGSWFMDEKGKPIEELKLHPAKRHRCQKYVSCRAGCACQV